MYVNDAVYCLKSAREAEGDTYENESYPDKRNPEL